MKDIRTFWREWKVLIGLFLFGVLFALEGLFLYKTASVMPLLWGAVLLAIWVTAVILVFHDSRLLSKAHALEEGKGEGEQR